MAELEKDTWTSGQANGETSLSSPCLTPASSVSHYTGDQKFYGILVPEIPLVVGLRALPPSSHL